MARDKRDESLLPRLNLQEVEPDAPPGGGLETGPLPAGFLMEQLLLQWDGLPTAAQLSVARLALDGLLETLDPDARHTLAEELGLLRESFH